MRMKYLQLKRKECSLKNLFFQKIYKYLYSILRDSMSSARNNILKQINEQ